VRLHRIQRRVNSANVGHPESEFVVAPGIQFTGDDVPDPGGLISCGGVDRSDTGSSAVKVQTFGTASEIRGPVSQCLFSRVTADAERLGMMISAVNERALCGTTPAIASSSRTCRLVVRAGESQACP